MKKVDTMEMERTQSAVGPAKRIRRTHSTEFKARVVQACEARGASVAGVALAHGVNANLVRKWIINKQRSAAPIAKAGLLPVHILARSANTVIAVKPGSERGRGEAIEIETAGAVVRVRASFDSAALRDVVLVLRDTLMR